MIDTFEHVLLFAICILIMRLSLPLPTYDADIPAAPFLDVAFAASLSAAMAVPLWAAFEVIYWVGNYFLA